MKSDQPTCNIYSTIFLGKYSHKVAICSSRYLRNCVTKFIKLYSQGRSTIPPKILLKKMNPLVVPETSVKFKSAFMHA